MKNIIAAIALLAASAMPALADPAAAQPIKPLDRTQEYRMWSAEQMTNRLLNKLSRMTAVCNQPLVKASPGLSETCKEAILSAYPRVRAIREVAASGDEVQWAILIDATHKMETGIDPALNDLEHK